MVCKFENGGDGRFAIEPPLHYKMVCKFENGADGRFAIEPPSITKWFDCSNLVDSNTAAWLFFASGREATTSVWLSSMLLRKKQAAVPDVVMYNLA